MLGQCSSSERTQARVLVPNTSLPREARVSWRNISTCHPVPQRGHPILRPQAGGGSHAHTFPALDQPVVFLSQLLR